MKDYIGKSYPTLTSSHRSAESQVRSTRESFNGLQNGPEYYGSHPEACSLHPGRKSAEQGLGSSRLPTFSAQEKSYIKGTSDFLGVGHFTTRYITQKNFPSSRGNSYFTDRDLAELVDPHWPDPGSEWLYSVPWGFRRLLNFVKVYNGAPVPSPCLSLMDCVSIPSDIP